MKSRGLWAAVAVSVTSCLSLPGVSHSLGAFELVVDGAKLQASDKQELDFFGLSVAILGDTAIVGAPGPGVVGIFRGAAYVFERDEGGPNNWGEVKEIQSSDLEGSEEFGFSVAIAGDVVIVGAPLESTGGTDAGAAYIFERDQGGGNNWGQLTKLQASDKEALDEFGLRVAVAGDTAVVGAPLEDTGGHDAGAAYIFERNQGGPNNWGEIKKLQASDTEERDVFGHSVATSGGTVIVGAPHEDASGLSAGAAYIFERDQGGPDNWGEVEKLLASDGEELDVFGFQVALSGDLAIAGAPAEDTGGLTAGAAYVFSRDRGGPDSWGEVAKIQASDREEGDEFGRSVATSEDTPIVGAPFEDTGGLSAGAAYVFELAATAEAMIEELIAAVDELAATGVLGHGQANSLTSKLRSALLSLDKGQEIAAANKLTAFISQVEAFVAAGILTTAQAQPLIDLAIVAIEEI